VIAMANEGLSVNKAGALAGVAHSSLYYNPGPRFVAPKPEAVSLVKHWCMAKPAYGYRRITAMIRRQGLKVNHKRVHRIMRLNGWLKPFHKRYRKRTGKTLPQPIGSNEFWQADMTKIWCGVDGWCYLFNILDCFDRSWVGYNFATTCATADNEPSVTAALQSRSPETMQLPGLVFQSDNGGQYTSNRFERFLKLAGFVHETIRKKTPEDNAFIESFHATLKTEYIWPHDFESFQHASQVIQDAFNDYNNERIHSAIGYLTPAEKYSQFLQKELKEVSVKLC